jgi:hypothetical protein
MNKKRIVIMLVSLCFITLALEGCGGVKSNGAEPKPATAEPIATAAPDFGCSYYPIENIGCGRDGVIANFKLTVLNAQGDGPIYGPDGPTLPNIGISYNHLIVISKAVLDDDREKDTFFRGVATEVADFHGRCISTTPFGDRGDQPANTASCPRLWSYVLIDADKLQP